MFFISSSFGFNFWEFDCKTTSFHFNEVPFYTLRFGRLTFSSPEAALLFGQHQESRPLARSNDIPVLNGFVNTIDWHQNQSDLSDLNLSMRKVTGSPWIAEFRYWTWPEVRSRLLLLTKRSAASGDENGRLSTCSWKVEFLHEVCQHIHNLLIKSCWISRSRVLWVALGFLILSVGWWLSDLIQANLLCCRIARLRKGLLKLGKSLAGLEFCETCYSTLRRRQISDKSYRFIRRSI